MSNSWPDIMIGSAYREVVENFDAYDTTPVSKRQARAYGGFDPLVSIARRRGRAHDLCVCACGWKGKHHELMNVGWRGGMNHKIMRRPDGFCPTCSKRPFWMPLTEAQAAILAP